MSRENALTKSDTETRVRDILGKIRALPFPRSLLLYPSSISRFLASHREAEYRRVTRERRRCSRTCNSWAEFLPIYERRNRKPWRTCGVLLHQPTAIVEWYPLLDCSYGPFVGGIIEIVRGSVNSSDHWRGNILRGFPDFVSLLCSRSIEELRRFDYVRPEIRFISNVMYLMMKISLVVKVKYVLLLEKKIS